MLKTIGAIFGAGAGCGLLILLCLLTAVAGFGWFLIDTYYVNPVRQEARGERTVQSAENQLPAYKHFFDLCASVRTRETTLDALFDQRDATTNQESLETINANIVGNQAARSEAINTYNADSADYTEGQFKDADLPYRLDETAYTKKGPHTNCAF